MKKIAVLTVLAIMLSLLISCNSTETEQTQSTTVGTTSVTTTTTEAAGANDPDAPDNDDVKEPPADDKEDEDQSGDNTDNENNEDNKDDGINGGDNTDDDNTDSGSTDEGNTDNGNTDNGNTDNGNTDNGNTDNGNTDNGNTDEGNTDGDTTVGGGEGSVEGEEKSEMAVAVEKIAQSLAQLLQQDSKLSSATSFAVAGISSVGVKNTSEVLFSAESFEFVAQNNTVNFGEQQPATDMVYKDGYLYISSVKDGVPTYSKIKIDAQEILNLLLTGGLGNILPESGQTQPVLLLEADSTDGEQGSIDLDSLFNEIIYTEGENGETVIVFRGVDSSLINAELTKLLDSVSQEELDRMLEGADASLVSVFNSFVDSVKKDKVKYDVSVTSVIDADGNFSSADVLVKVKTTQKIFGVSVDLTLFDITHTTTGARCEEKVVVELPENADEYVETTVEEALGSIGGMGDLGGIIPST